MLHVSDISDLFSTIFKFESQDFGSVGREVPKHQISWTPSLELPDKLEAEHYA